jgi:hypothetical protein
MIKKIAIIASLMAIFFFVYSISNYSYTSFVSSSAKTGFGLILIFLFIFLIILLFFGRKKEEKILEKSGVKGSVEREKLLQEYDMRRYLEDLRNNIDYVGKLYGKMKSEFDKVGYLESVEKEELEKNLRRTGKILNLLYSALRYLKEGKNYHCVTDVEDAWRTSENLPYSDLREKLGTLASKLRETYTLGTIKLKEQEKKLHKSIR